MKPVVIVGAGIAGLTAGYLLQRSGIPVIVLEASSEIGGVIRSRAENGFLAEHGPHSLLESSRIAELVDELDLADQRIEANSAAKNRFIVRGGELCTLPRSPSSFLTSPVISASAKLRLFGEPFVSRSVGEESVAEFFTRKFGREVADYLVDPFVGGIYAGDAQALSMACAFPKLHTLEQKHGSISVGLLKEFFKSGARKSQRIISFRNGIATLPQALARRLDARISLHARVESIKSTENGWKVDYVNNASSADNGAQKRIEASAIIFAGPIHRLCSVLHAPQSKLADPAAKLATIAHPPVASVAFGFRRADIDHPLDGFGLLVPRSERMHILGTLFSSSIFPGRAPADHVLLTTFVGGARSPETALEEPAVLEKKILGDLDTLLGIHARPVFASHRVYEKAIPQYNIGYQHHQETMNDLEKNNPGLFLAGSYRRGISVGDAIESSYDVVIRVGERVRGS